MPASGFSRADKVGVRWTIDQTDGHQQLRIKFATLTPAANSRYKVGFNNQDLTNQDPEECQAGAESVVEDGLLYGHSRLQQNGEVSQLVRQLMAEDSQRRAQPSRYAAAESGAWKRGTLLLIGRRLADAEDHSSDAGNGLYDA